MTETNGHTATRPGKAQRRLFRWLLWWRRLWNPWLCPSCGAEMVSVLWSLPPEAKWAHFRAGTAHLLTECFRCPAGCHKDNECVMISW